MTTSLPVNNVGVRAYRRLHGDSFNCSGLHRVGFTVVAVATMIAFIPLGLAASLVFHHSDSNSPQITAMASGWYKFYATFTKAVMVLSLLLFAPSSPAVVALVICALQLGITAYVANTLPYFRLWMNRLVAALHGTLAYLALGSFVMSGGQSSQFADGWAAGGVLALLVGAWLPSVKYRYEMWTKPFLWRHTILTRGAELMLHAGCYWRVWRSCTSRWPSTSPTSTHVQHPHC